MAIQYVGGVDSGRAGSTGTTTQSLSGTLTGGLASSPAEGDLVIINIVAAGTNTYPVSTLAVSDWTNGTFRSYTANTYNAYSQYSYKFMTSTPDTSITIPSSGNIRNAQSWTVQVWRGVGTTTPFDVSVVFASGTTGRPNPGAVTPVTAGAVILWLGGSAAATGAAYTAPTDFSTNWLTRTDSDTQDSMIGAGYYTGWTSGQYDPAAITAGGTTSTTADSWVAETVVLRPAPPALTATPSDTPVFSESLVITKDYGRTLSDTPQFNETVAKSLNKYISQSTTSLEELSYAGFSASDGIALTSYNPSWVVPFGAFYILSNQLRGGAGECLAYDNAVTASNNQYARCTASLLTTGNGRIGLAVRCGSTSGGYGYQAYWHNANVDIGYYLDGSWFLIYRYNTPPTQGTIVRLQIVNNILSLWYGSTLQWAREVTYITSAGKPGISAYDNTDGLNLLDSWSGGNVRGGTEEVIYTETVAKSLSKVINETINFSESLDAQISQNQNLTSTPGDTPTFSERLDITLKPININLRSLKGSALTTAQLDYNLTYLNENKIDLTIYPITSTSGLVIDTYLSGTKYSTYLVGALAEAMSISSSGTHPDGIQKIIKIKDNGTARALSWAANFRGIGVSLPTTTVAGKYISIYIIYNNAASYWDVIDIVNEV